MPDAADNHLPDSGNDDHPSLGKAGGAGSARAEPADSDARDSDGDATVAMAQLRQLLLGPQQEQIETIRNRIDDSSLRSEDIAEVLPDAVRRSAARDDRLAKALGPSIGTAIKTSIKNDPGPLIDAIFPIIGPAIRRAISDALAGMMQSLNQAMEHSLTVQGLRWRLEAARAGKSFAEVVLLHTLAYRVEQVFLIHAETGLLLRHVGVQGARVADERMVSGMITAIQDFVRDSFGNKDEQLDRMRLGEMSVCFERGPAVVLAAVIRGTPPAEVRKTLQETVETIHQDYSDQLDGFEGDVTAFAPASDLLDGCLLQAAQKKVKPKVPLGRLIFIFVLCVLLGLLIYWRVSQAARWGNYVEALRSTPGLIVVEEDRGWFRHRIRGLRDPLAEDPVSMLTAYKLTAEKLDAEWRLYESLDPPMVEARNAARPDPEAALLHAARHTLEPPAGVTLTVQGSTVIASGEAAHRWLVEAEAKAAAVPGLTHLNLRGVTDRTLTRTRQLITEIERVEIPFDSGWTQVPADYSGAIADIASRLLELSQHADALGVEVSVRVVGHSDPVGDEASRRRVSQERADSVLAALLRHQPGLPPMSAVGVGSTDPVRPENPGEDDRRVSFAVDLKQSLPDRFKP